MLFSSCVLAAPAINEPKNSAAPGTNVSATSSLTPEISSARIFGTRDEAENRNESNESGSAGSDNSGIKPDPDQASGSSRWAVNTKGLKPFTGHKAEISALFTFSPAGPVKSLVSIDKQGVIALWPAGAHRGLAFAKINREIGPLALYPKTGLLAVAEKDLLHVYQLDTLAERYMLTRNKANITSLAFTPDGEALIFGAADARVYRWKFVQDEKGADEQVREKSLERYIGHASIVGSVAAHPSGRVFFSGDWRGGISAWLPYDADAFAGEYDKSIFQGLTFADKVIRMKGSRDQDGSVDLINVTPDGELALAAIQTGNLEAWIVRGFRRGGTTKAHPGVMYDLATSPNSKRAATLGRDGKLKVWDIFVKPAVGTTLSTVTLTALAELQIPGARRVTFVADDRLVVGTSSGALQQVSLATGADSKPTIAELRGL